MDGEPAGTGSGEPEAGRYPEAGRGEPEAGRYPEASRRTYYAEERTLLAWWRTGIAAAAVALGVGGVVPHLTGLPRDRFLALGAGYGLLALIFVLGGTLRARRSYGALDRGDFAGVPWAVLMIVSAYVAVLIILTIVALF